MVFYFLSTACDPPAYLYMGKDKYENEDLIKYGHDEDIWFHVDKHSSAHVYIRMNPGDSWESIPMSLIEDCAQLCKANSIEGNKLNDITVVYTPWSNLKKTAGMDAGQVSYHNPRLVKSIRIEKRQNDIINRLNRTKEERFPNLQAERVARDKRVREEQRQIVAAKEREQAEAAKKAAAAADLRSYKGVMTEENMTSNAFEAGVSYKAVEDDFM